MKTRIVHTKIWDDEFFSQLTPTEKLLFIYYITNPRIGLTGMYELTERIISFETGLNKDQIEKGNQKFEASNKIHFYKSWVYVINASKLGGYAGGNIDKATKTEIESLPEGVFQYFTDPTVTYEAPYKPLQGGVEVAEATINHKPEIINHKSEEKGIVKGKNIITEEVMQEIADKYQVPIAFVRSKWDDLQNYCASHGKTYKDYKAALSDWVKRDSLKIRQDTAKQQGKVAVQT